MKTENTRPTFPKRVLVTAGMPYGSKELHFGHIGGVFVHADVYARFMRDRIGKDNVIFVSGTDCYGSPIVEKYRELKEAGLFEGSMTDFVEQNHASQRETLEKYGVSLSLFGASGLGATGREHTKFSEEFFSRLFASGRVREMSTAQFYDEERGVFLNGRQVMGRCPIAGCRSEHAYADECSLGHQYFPEDLIAPVSTLSGTRPVLKNVRNWYFDMSDLFDYLKSVVEAWQKDDMVRDFSTVVCDEFLKRPALQLKLENKEEALALLDGFDISVEDNEKQKNCKITFASLEDRERATKLLANGEIRYRTNKTVVPFRLSGNVEWGVPVPEKNGMSGLTFWVWPESLWAPISFTRAYLESVGKSAEEWKDWWCSDDARVVQFIGEDNIYFYALAEPAMFRAISETDETWNFSLPTIVANKHILFFDKKASSSGAIKPPMAKELLEHYSAEQLRAHFLALGLQKASVPFRPKPYSPDPNSNEGDPVYREFGAFTNLLNRAIRTTFYTFQQYNGGNAAMPVGTVSPEVKEICDEALLRYESYMAKLEFSNVMPVMEDFFRYYNKSLSANTKKLQTEFDASLYRQTMIDAFHIMKTAALMAHPVAPESVMNVAKYLGASDELFDWQNAFATFEEMYGEGHVVEFLEPKVDFFARPEWQYNA